ncbi:MAG: cob(I)yrinic acid a,c-diamide adenosyltransferase [Phycisphaerales bacterium]|nr:cob(I)yrinic acid a,c-diamide adenosyltransferase [Phycisphaerales bacterium]
MMLYTKTGDDGSTGLIGGPRVSKCDPRVAAYGEVDEINAAIGVVVAGCADAQIVDRLRRIQSELFVIGAELATPDGQMPNPRIGDAQVAQLERWIDEASAGTPPLRNFVLPGGTFAAASLHLARTVCRRAERAVVSLSQHHSVSRTVVIYLNRLSDLLFALARLANHRADVPEIPWTAPKG